MSSSVSGDFHSIWNENFDVWLKNVDARIVEKQKRIAAALGGIGAAISLLISIESVDTDAQSEKVLSENILSLLGDRLTDNRVLAPPLHQDFAKRWE